MTQVQLKEMANRIKDRREDLGITQEHFSEAIDISASSYTKIENAFQRPSLSTLIKIAEQMELSLDYLVFGREKENEINLTEDDQLRICVQNVDIETLQKASRFLNKIATIKHR